MYDIFENEYNEDKENKYSTYNYVYQEYLNLKNKIVDKKIIFEGEYSNGERKFGYIWKYSDLGILLCEGEFLNGEINGKGKEYSDLELIFEGNFLNGKRNGKGKEYTNNELIFEGNFLNGKRNGMEKL